MFGVLFIISCSKDEVKPVSYSVKVENGMFSFSSFEEMNSFTNSYDLMTFNEQKEFHKIKGVNTYEHIFQTIIFEQDKLEEKIAPNFDPSEYGRILAPKSDYYKESLKKGYIYVVEDNRESHIYRRNLMDPTSSTVVNDLGCFKVGKDIYQHTKDQIKVCKDCTAKNFATMLDCKITNEGQNIYTFSRKSNLRETNNWSNSEPDFQDVGSRKRAKWWYEGYSIISDACETCLMTTKFYAQGEAQRRNIWGNFVFTSGFTPTFRFDGSWDGDASYFYCTNDPGAPPAFLSIPMSLSDFSLSVGVTNTPMVNRTFMRTNIISGRVKFHPHTDGAWDRPPFYSGSYSADKCYETPHSIYSIDIDGRLTTDCGPCDLND